MGDPILILICNDHSLCPAHSFSGYLVPQHLSNTVLNPCLAAHLHVAAHNFMVAASHLAGMLIHLF